MRYIVTGGAGFIGSNLADVLARDHDVVIIDNLATGSAGDVQRHPGKPGTMVEQLRENNLFMPIFLRETLRVLT